MLLSVQEGDRSKLHVCALCRLLAPTYAKNMSANFPIQVDEDAQTVRVQAGITQRILLDYLANYTCALTTLFRSLLSTSTCNVTTEYICTGLGQKNA